MINMEKYDYFINVKENAVFTEKSCQICGKNENCLEGVYFEQPELKSICLSCLDKKKMGVDVPDYIKKLVHKDNVIKIEKLKYTPPVPWVQYNDWQVCCDNYMQYIGEWQQEDFIREAGNREGIEYFKSLLCEDLKNKVEDISILWDDLGYDTVAFVFRCVSCDKRVVVCQSY